MTGSKQVVSSQSPGTGAETAQSSFSCPRKARPKENDRKLENFRTPPATTLPSVLDTFAMLAYCKAAGKKILFDLWKRTEGEISLVLLLPWSLTPWLATTTQIERVGTSKERTAKAADHLVNNQLGLGLTDLNQCRDQTPRVVVDAFNSAPHC